MACQVYRWTLDRKPEIEAAVRASRTRAEAAGKLGVTTNALDHACRGFGLSIGRLLATGGAAPASAGVLVSGSMSGSEARQRPEAEEPFDVPPLRALSSEGVERRLVIADLHMPVHSVAATACALQIARVLQPHVIILAGDLANMSGLSHHPPYAVARETFEASTGGVRAFIRALRRSVGSRIYVLEGNHEKWGRDYEVAYPGTAGGTFDVPVAFGIAPRPDAEDPGLVMDATWVPEEAQPLVLGPVAYLHGTCGGDHYAKRYADTVGPRSRVRCVVTGHHHSFQHYSHKNGVEAWGCGYLGDGRSEAFDYAKPPRGWEHGVLLQDVAGDAVTTTKIPIVSGRALVAGRVIAAAA